MRSRTFTLQIGRLRSSSNCRWLPNESDANRFLTRRRKSTWPKGTNSVPYWNPKAVSGLVPARRSLQSLTYDLELQATLNTSAGQKQKLILESEGQLEAAKNEGLALARQVEILAQSLVAEPSAKPTDEDKRRALDALLELRRLEQLKAIAAGHGNSTYFFGYAKGTGRDVYDVENVEKWKRSLNDEKKFAFSTVVGGAA